MPFPNTIKLLCKYNTNPSAKIPKLYSIALNNVTINDGLEISNNRIKEIRIFFLKELKENNKKGIYYHGSPHKIFLKYYEVTLEKYLKEHADGDESDFIMSELALGIMNYEFPFINNRDEYDIMLALKKRLIFLEKRLNFYGQGLEIKQKPNKNSKYGYDEVINVYFDSNIKNRSEINCYLQWQDNPTNFVEFIKGVALKKSFGDASEKEITEKFEVFFNFKLNDYKGTKDKIRKRKKELTPYFNDVIYRFEKWRKNLDNKNKKDDQRMY